MKKKRTRWLTALLAAALLLTAVPCAYAQGAPGLQEMEVTAKRLKVRHHPGIDDVPVVTELKRGRQGDAAWHKRQMVVCKMGQRGP